MKNKTLTLPAIIIAIGLVVALVGCLLTSMQFKPAVTEQDFNYSVTYKIDGETKTFSGVYTCRFTGFGKSGFFVQFLGIIVEVILAVLEYAL